MAHMKKHLINMDKSYMIFYNQTLVIEASKVNTKLINNLHITFENIKISKVNMVRSFLEVDFVTDCLDVRVTALEIKS